MQRGGVYKKSNEGGDSMKSLESILLKLEQVDSLMYSIEGAMIEVADEELNDEAKRLHNLIYLLWNQLQQITKEVIEVNGHIEVCNAVYAVNRVEELRRELAEMKNEA